MNQLCNKIGLLLLGCVILAATAPLTYAQHDPVAPAVSALQQAADPIPASADPVLPTTGYIDWKLVWEVTIGGMVVVMVVLWALAIIVGLMNRFEIRSEAKAAAAALAARPALAPSAAAPAVGPPEPAIPREVADEIHAVIAAAVAVALRGRAFRIRGFEPAAAHPQSSAWAQMGRMRIHTSHNIQKR